MTTIALIMVWLYGCMYVLFLGGLINATFEERIKIKRSQKSNYYKHAKAYTIINFRGENKYGKRKKIIIDDLVSEILKDYQDDKVINQQAIFHSRIKIQ